MILIIDLHDVDQVIGKRQLTNPLYVVGSLV